MIPTTLMPRTKSVTIYDVAQLAGVSSATVSRVINGKRVDEAMALRVQQVIQETGFQPNQLARSLYTQESRVLGCLFPDLSNPFYAALFMAIERQALNSGYTLLLCTSLDDPETEARNLKIMSEHHVDAILLAGGRICKIDPDGAVLADTRRLQGRTPLVMVNGEVPGIECAWVQVDEVRGVREGARHLLGLGHTRLALLGGLPTTRITHLKRVAFQEELRHAGADQAWFCDSGYGFADGVSTMKSMLDLPESERPTAVLGINDLVAIGAAHAAIASGLRIPGDISIAGFDDISMAAVFFPPLTSISHQYEELAALTLQAAIAAIRGEHPHHVLPPLLVVRDSTAAPNPHL